jgi:hypothetical protein
MSKGERGAGCMKVHAAIIPGHAAIQAAGDIIVPGLGPKPNMAAGVVMPAHGFVNAANGEAGIPPGVISRNQISNGLAGAGAGKNRLNGNGVAEFGMRSPGSVATFQRAGFESINSDFRGAGVGP